MSPEQSSLGKYMEVSREPSVETEVCPNCGSIIAVKPFAAYCKKCGYARKFKKGHEGEY